MRRRIHRFADFLGYVSGLEVAVFREAQKGNADFSEYSFNLGVTLHSVGAFMRLVINLDG